MPFSLMLIFCTLYRSTNRLKLRVKILLTDIQFKILCFSRQQRSCFLHSSLFMFSLHEIYLPSGDISLLNKLQNKFCRCIYIDLIKVKVENAIIFINNVYRIDSRLKKGTICTTPYTYAL